MSAGLGLACECCEQRPDNVEVYVSGEEAVAICGVCADQLRVAAAGLTEPGEQQ